MAFIIEVPSSSGTTWYEIIDGAQHVSLSDGGALLVWDSSSSSSRSILAIYQPGEWLAARKDGVARRANSSKVFEPLAVSTLGQSTN